MQDAMALDSAGPLWSRPDDAPPLPPLPAWHARAACRDADRELFFAHGYGPEPGRRRAEALRYCAGCPVIRECLAWALEHREHGVWGGTTDRDRARLAAAARRPGTAPVAQPA